MIIYEGVEFESPEEILLGNPSVNYTKQIEQKYVVLLYRYHFNEIPNYIKIRVETVFIILINERSNLIHTKSKLAQKRISNRFC